MERYQNLMVREALSNNHLYPIVCNELSSIINMAYSKLPKDIKALIFEDTLSAFRLLPDNNTSTAILAANLLLKNMIAVLPKHKKNLAIVEFKKAKVALKRRNKSHEEDIDIDTPSLPQDILIHIFSLLELSSLLSSSGVSRSWNQATYDESLWRTQFDLYFNHKALIRTQSGTDWREAFKSACIADDSSKALRSGRGHCSYCDSIIWHNDMRCPNEQCRLESGNSPVDLISTHQVVDYLVGRVFSPYQSDSDDEDIPRRNKYGQRIFDESEFPTVDESESDDEAVPGLWAGPTLVSSYESESDDETIPDYDRPTPY